MTQYCDCIKHLLDARQCSPCSTSINPLNLTTALWGLLEPMAPENYWTGRVESSSIPGSQEPESCYAHSFFKGQRIKLPEISSCQAGTAGAQVCGCPSPDTTRWVCPGDAKLLSTFTWSPSTVGLTCTLSTPQSFPVRTVGKFIPLLWDTWTCYLAMSSFYIISVNPTTCTIPLFLFTCFCIQCLPVSVKWMLNEEWVERQKTILLDQ